MLSLVFTVRDAKNKKSTVKLWLPANTTVAGATAIADSVGPIIKQLILGEIVSVSLTADIPVVAGAQGAADLTSDVEEKGRFMFRTAAGKSVRVSLPTWNETYTLPNTASIDQTDTDVDAFIQYFLSGGVDSNGSLITSIEAAYESYE